MAKWSFVSHITDYLKRPRWGQSKAPTLWPSEASAVVINEYDEEVTEGRCRRSTYFRYLVASFEYYTEAYSMFEPLVKSLKREYIPVDNYMRWIWEQGNLYEEYCINKAKESGIFIAEQVPIYIPEYNVSGKLDIVVIDPTTGLYRTTEVKSVYGYGANAVLGTPGERKRGLLGKPRSSNLMQIGIYDWWYMSRREDFGTSLLTYGARDTGRYAEYEIDTGQEEDGLSYIKYTGISPNETEQTVSNISIENILEQYKYIQLCLNSGEIPHRDFDLSYSEEKIDKLYERNLLNRTNKTRYEKRKQQQADGKTKLIKPVEMGDWQCNRCSYKNICYSKDGTPREI